MERRNFIKSTLAVSGTLVVAPVVVAAALTPESDVDKLVRLYSEVAYDIEMHWRKKREASIRFSLGRLHTAMMLAL